MAKNCFKPGEEHRERIFSLFQTLAKQKAGENKKSSRGEIEREIRENPGKHPELEKITDPYLRICITKILNTDPRTAPDPVWRWVWVLNEVRS
jgi:hypothetical protein